MKKFVWIFAALSTMTFTGSFAAELADEVTAQGEQVEEVAVVEEAAAEAEAE